MPNTLNLGIVSASQPPPIHHTFTWRETKMFFKKSKAGSRGLNNSSLFWGGERLIIKGTIPFVFVRVGQGVDGANELQY